MNDKDCSTCKKMTSQGLNILGIHICRECLNSIENLQVDELNYDYYKNIIKNAWKNYYELQTN